MKQGIDIHNYPKRMESALANLKKDSISEENKDLILKFYEQCVLEGLSKPHIIKYIYILRVIARELNKGLDIATKSDIQSFVRYIQETNFSMYTKHAYKIALKKFYKWLKGNNEEYPEEVKWLKGNSKKNMKLPASGELVTEEDVKRLIEVGENSRDKALVSMLYESGCRIGEIATLQIYNVKFDDYGVLINVEGKTGSRQIRLVASVPHIATWLQNHPLKENRLAPLWITIGTKNHNQLLQYGALRALLRRLFKRAHIDKKMNPHSFRHARASFMANHLTEFQMNQYFGWTQGSNMAAVYVHLSGKETDAAILELNGFKTEEHKNHRQSLLKPKKCSRCDTINSHESKFCSKCAAPLDIQTAIQIEEARKEEIKLRAESDQIMNNLLKDEKVREFLLQMIKEKGLNNISS